MHFINQQIDRRRCFLCAEPITGRVCIRCGHVHKVTEHEEFAVVLARLKAGYKRAELFSREGRRTDVSD